MKLSKIFTAVAVTAAALAASSANATFIKGSIGLSGGFSTLANLPASMVSQLTAVDVDGSSISLAGGNTGFGTVIKQTTGTSSDFTIGTAPVNPLYTIGAFTFNLSAFTAPVRTAITCDASGQCTDKLSFNGTGTVLSTIAGQDATGFTLSWTATGTCNAAASGTVCDSAANFQNASWTAQISATGKEALPAQTPEPGSLALAGLALLGLGVARKAKKA